MTAEEIRAIEIPNTEFGQSANEQNTALLLLAREFVAQQAELTAAPSRRLDLENNPPIFVQKNDDGSLRFGETLTGTASPDNGQKEG
jgi:hypothetical protein